MRDVRGRGNRAGDYSVNAIPWASGLVISRDLGLTYWYGPTEEGWLTCKEFAAIWIGSVGRLIFLGIRYSIR